MRDVVVLRVVGSKPDPEKRPFEPRGKKVRHPGELMAIDIHIRMRSKVKISVKAFAGLVLLLAPVLVRAQAAAQATGQASSQTASVQKQIEAYLRNMYAFGSDVQVTVSAPKESKVAGLLETDVVVKIGDSNENANLPTALTGTAGALCPVRGHFASAGWMATGAPVRCFSSRALPKWSKCP